MNCKWNTMMYANASYSPFTFKSSPYCRKYDTVTIILHYHRDTINYPACNSWQLVVNSRLWRGKERRSFSRDTWAGLPHWPRARTMAKTKMEGGEKKKETIESSPDVSPLRIFGLRRADEARARSLLNTAAAGTPSDHWSLSQEGTQKEENRLPPAKKNATQHVLPSVVQRLF